MRTFLLAAVLLLPACQQTSEPAPEPTPTPSPEALTSLEGDFEVVDIDARDLRPSEPVVLHIADGRIDFDNCQRIGWEATFDGAKLRTERSPPPGEPCKDKLAGPVLQMVSAIDAADEAERQPDGKVMLIGGLRSVTLAER